MTEVDPPAAARADETSGPPAGVQIAIFGAYALAAALVLFGVLGFLISETIGDSFGAGAFVLGLIVAGAAYLASRGRSVGRAVIGLGAALTAVVGVIYAFTGPSSAVIPSLVIAAMAAATFALLYLSDSAKRFFARS